MTTNEYLTIGAATLSLIISVSALFYTNKFSKYDIRLARRFELHSLMHELDRLAIEKPELYKLYRSFSDETKSYPEPSSPVRESYVLMFLNLFEMSHSIFNETKNLSTKEKEIANAWNATIKEFFDDCPSAKDVWEKLKHTYYQSFQDYIEENISK